MKEYIAREAAIFEFETNGSNFVYGKKACNAIISRLKTIPAADVVEVRHGRWNNGYEVQNCSECGYRGKRSYRYCPNCGAKMGDEDVQV